MADGGPKVELGDGLVVSMADILARVVKHGGMDGWEDAIDELIVEHRGELDEVRTARRARRQAIGKPARPEPPPRIPIDEPRPIAGIDGALCSGAWAGRGVVGLANPTNRIELYSWADPSAQARRVTELGGMFRYRRLAVAPSGEAVAMHLARDGRPGGGWANDFAAIVIIDLATGDTRTVVESTRAFEVDACPVWSCDGARLAVMGADWRGPPPLPRMIRVLEVAGGRSIASLERRGMRGPVRFEGDDLIVEIDRRWQRWQLGSSTLVDVPTEQRWPPYVLPSGEPAHVLDEAPDGRLLLLQAGALAWSRRHGTGTR